MTSSSSSGSAAIHDQGPNVINDPTAVVEETLEEKEDNVKREQKPDDYDEEMEERKDIKEEQDELKEDGEVEKEKEEEEKYLPTQVVPLTSVHEPTKELSEGNVCLKQYSYF